MTRLAAVACCDAPRMHLQASMKETGFLYGFLCTFENANDLSLMFEGLLLGLRLRDENVLDDPEIVSESYSLCFEHLILQRGH